MIYKCAAVRHADLLESAARRDLARAAVCGARVFAARCSDADSFGFNDSAATKGAGLVEDSPTSERANDNVLSGTLVVEKCATRLVRHLPVEAAVRVAQEAAAGVDAASNMARPSIAIKLPECAYNTMMAFNFGCVRRRARE